MPASYAKRLIVAVAVTIGAVALVAAGIVVVVDRAAAGPSHHHHRIAAPQPPPPPAGTRHPNIVLILTDDQRWDTLWSMPNVRRLLVDHGVTFTNAFVTNSFCCPSRSTILTGNYSHTTGQHGSRRPRSAPPTTSRSGSRSSSATTRSRRSRGATPTSS